MFDGGSRSPIVHYYFVLVIEQSVGAGSEVEGNLEIQAHPAEGMMEPRL